MRKWLDLLNEASQTKFTKDQISRIGEISQERFNVHRPAMKMLGDLTDRLGRTFKVWGYSDFDEARYYVGDLEEKVVGYIVLRRSSPEEMIKKVSMVFVMPKFKKKGIGSALYRFALKQEGALMSDKSITGEAKKIWKSFLADPSVALTYRDEDEGAEKPLVRIDTAFRDPHRQIIARPKNLIEYRERGLSMFTHDEHRYNLNKLFNLSEDIPVEEFSVDVLKWVLNWDEPDPERVKAADLSVPILITKSGKDVPEEERFVVIDGLHRLAKAVEEGIDTLPGRVVPTEMLEQCDLTVFIRNMRKRLAKVLSEDEENDSFVIPTIWYHSTDHDPVEVARDFSSNNLNPVGGDLGDEYWFSDDWEASRYYGPNTVVAKLSIKNPLLVTSAMFKANSPRGPSSYWAKKARDEGYDAVIIHDIMDGDMFSTVCAVFSAQQIDAKPYSRYDEDTDSFIKY